LSQTNPPFFLNSLTGKQRAEERQKKIDLEFITKIEYLIEHRHEIPQDLWKEGVVPLCYCDLTREDPRETSSMFGTLTFNAGGSDFLRLVLDKDGLLLERIRSDGSDVFITTGTTRSEKHIERQYLTPNRLLLLLNSRDNNNRKWIVTEIRDIILEYHSLIKPEPQFSDLKFLHNQELRRVVIKKIGWEKIEKNTTVLDRYQDYVLFDIKEEKSDYGRFLKMKDASTDRIYLLRVPRFIDFGIWHCPLDKCKDAIAWSFSKPSKKYNPEVET